MRLRFAADFNGRVRYDEPMSAHTSWHAGGPADALFSPRDVDDLSAFLRAVPADVKLYWVGLGSNLLVREGGIRGVVIATPGAFTRIERRSQTRVYCEASVPCARIARLCVKWGLGQGEFFSGIPGTLGGALAMNAGAFGDETWRHVLSIESIDRRCQRRVRQAQEFRVGYRHLDWPPGAAEEWFLSAELAFEALAVNAPHSVQSLMQRRRDTQPLGQWSCGSVFKNPPGDHAARLIEAAGLKGYRIGDAAVSDKHANFIVNLGNARAAELEQLIRHVQATVQRTHGVMLEPEVRIIGEPAAAAGAVAAGAIALGDAGGSAGANEGRH
ncbi:MAG TPA: UDP-N-acetylmuramate dehydrogenase [Steroidobacteraceae bacterium]|nr:UDP-N-acetylmuramate dehydrogenase [Steroidobacteraceae bacterium]